MIARFMSFYKPGVTSTLSRQIISGDDKDDEEIITRDDAVRAEAIHAIEGFLN